MKKQSYLLGLALVCSMLLMPAKSYADVTSTGDSYTVTIPTAASVILDGASSTLQPSSQYWGVGRAAAVSNDGANTIVVGNGTAGTSTSYVITNDPVTAAGLQYQISVAGDNGDNAVFSDNSTNAVLTLTDSDVATSVDIIVRNNSAATYPTLGVTAPVPFEVLNSSTLDIDGVATNVQFGAGTNEAPLDMLLDLDESSLSYTEDPPCDLSFTLTMKVVGIEY